MKNKYFFILQDHEVKGPFLASTLDQLFHAGTLNEETPVSADKKTWLSLADALYKKTGSDVKILVEKPDPASDNDVISLFPGPEKEAPPLEEPVTPAEVPPAIQKHAGDDLWEVIGETLHLLWNTPDKLESMTHFSSRSIYRIMLPVCLIFMLFVSQAAAISIACFWGGFLKKMLFVFLATLLSAVLFSIEMILIQLKNTGQEQEKLRSAAVMTGMCWINFGAVTGIGALHFALTVLPGAGTMPLWVTAISTVFYLFVCCFFFSNMAAGLRIGFSSFFGLRPRFAVWCSALFLWQYFLLLYFMYVLADKFIK